MKNIFKKAIVLLMICCFCTCVLTSCGEEGKLKSYIEDFFAAVEAGDYAKAESFVHPTRLLDAQTYFTGIEKKSGVDFQKGIEIEKYVSIEHSDYSKDVNGSMDTIIVRTRVSGVIVRFEIKIVKNAYGYGIYNLKTVK